MDISMKKLEELIVDFIIKENKIPKYILMDRLTYENYSRSICPIERIPTNTEKHKPLRIYTTDAKVDILSVNTDNEFLELV